MALFSPMLASLSFSLSPSTSSKASRMSFLRMNARDRKLRTLPLERLQWIEFSQYPPVSKWQVFSSTLAGGRPHRVGTAL